MHNQELSGIGLSTVDNEGKTIGVEEGETIVVWTKTPADACGNGRKVAYELCDDGNTRNGDGCSSTCEVEADFRCAKYHSRGRRGDVTGSFVRRKQLPVTREQGCCRAVVPCCLLE